MSDPYVNDIPQAQLVQSAVRRLLKEPPGTVLMSAQSSSDVQNTRSASTQETYSARMRTDAKAIRPLRDTVRRQVEACPIEFDLIKE